MGLIQTFNSRSRSWSTSSNAAKGLGFIAETVYYANTTTSLKVIEFGKTVSTQVYSLVEYSSIISGLDLDTTDTILYVASTNTELVICILNGTTNKTDVYIIDVTSSSVNKMFTVSTNTVDRLDKNIDKFVMYYGTSCTVFRLDNTFVQTFTNVHSASVNGNELYVVLANDTNKLRKINTINFGTITALSTTNATEVLDAAEQINHVHVYAGSILFISTVNTIRTYSINSYALIHLLNSVIPHSVNKQVVNDDQGRIFTNTNYQSIFDINSGKLLSVANLPFISSIDLQNTRHVQSNSDGVAIQQTSKISIFTDMTDTAEKATVSKLVSNIGGSSYVDLGRIIEFEFPVGTHEFSLKCTEALTWQSNFDMTFYMRGGYDKRFTELSNDISIQCTVSLIVDDTPTEKNLTLTNAIKTTDILTTKYSLNDFVCSGDIRQTFGQWHRGKTVGFDTSTDNIKFTIIVPQDIFKIRKSVMYLQMLKHIQLYDASYITLT